MNRELNTGTSYEALVAEILDLSEEECEQLMLILASEPLDPRVNQEDSKQEYSFCG